MRGLVTDSIDHLLWDSHPYGHPRLGDHFAEHLERTESHMIKAFGEAPSVENKLHVAGLTFGMAINPFYFQREGMLGDNGLFPVHLPKALSSRRKLFANAIFGLPVIRPADKDFCYGSDDYAARCMGTPDRLVHLWLNFIIAHETRYASWYGLPEQRRKPNGLKLLMWLRRPNDMSSDITQQAGIVNYAHEEYETVYQQAKMTGRFGARGIGYKGFRDSLLRLDQAANADGRRLAEFLTVPSLTQERLQQGVEIMDSDRLIHVRHNDNAPSLLEIPGE